MTNWSSQLERAWAVLTRPAESELSSYPLDIAFATIACRVALDRDGHRHLLVPALDQKIVADPRPSILQAQVRKLSFGEDVDQYVDVSCEEHDLEHEFDEVIADVLSQVEAAQAPGEKALEAIVRWRRLFRSRLMRGLSYEAKLGLFAELVVLSSLIDADPSLDIACWRGPLNDPHDFEAPANCIEVKAIGARTSSIEVHGIRQLDTHEDRRLDLAVLTVSEDADGTSLDEMIDRISGRLDEQELFRLRLASAGWSEQEARLDGERFTVIESFVAPVTAAFPRIVESSLTAGLPEGLRSVTYALDVDAVRGHAGNETVASLAGLAVKR